MSILVASASYGPARKVPHPTAHPARGEIYTSGVFPQGLAAPHALARAAPTFIPQLFGRGSIGDAFRWRKNYFAFRIGGMLTESDSARSVAAVIQDALTGEILWVGHLNADAPKQIAESGVVRTTGLYDGDPVAVRHLSTRGDGFVIHIEGPGMRRQMDSMMPEAENPFSQPEFNELGFVVSARLDSGKWTKLSNPCCQERPFGVTEPVDSNPAAFSVAKDGETPEAIAERAATVLQSLFEELETARVPKSITLEAFRKRGLV
jgi:hypothetical protein